MVIHLENIFFNSFGLKKLSKSSDNWEKLAKMEKRIMETEKFVVWQTAARAVFFSLWKSRRYFKNTCYFPIMEIKKLKKRL